MLRPMKQPSKQQLKDRIAQLEKIISDSLELAVETDNNTAVANLGVSWDILRGEDLSKADLDTKIARRKELGLSLVCTADELDATPNVT